MKLLLLTLSLLILSCAPKTQMNTSVRVYAPPSYEYEEEEWKPPSFEKGLREIEGILAEIVKEKDGGGGGAILERLYNDRGIWE